MLLADVPVEVSVLAEFTKQLPAVAAILVVVWYFLKYIRESDNARNASELRRENIDNARAEALMKLGDNCHAFQAGLAKDYAAVGREMAVALNSNTQAFHRNSAVLDRVEKQLDRVEGVK